MDFTDKKGNTDLHLAKSAADVERLLEAGYPIDARNKDGWTPLHRACRLGNDEATATLLAHCAPLNATSNSGATPLHLAAQYGKLGSVELLLAKGAPVGAIDKKGDTPLLLACRHNHPLVVEALLGGSVSPAEINSSLHVAAASGSLGAVKALLAKGADPVSADDGGWIPLHSACKNGNPEVVWELLAKGGFPMVNTGDTGGWTPLHLAARYNHLAVTKMLVSAGAYVEATDGEEWTACDRARRHRHTELANYLTGVQHPCSK